MVEVRLIFAPTVQPQARLETFRVNHVFFLFPSSQSRDKCFVESVTAKAIARTLLFEEVYHDRSDTRFVLGDKRA